MSDLIKNHSINDAQLAADTDGVSEPDPFASLNKLLDENPEFKGTFDTVMQILGDNTPSDEDTEVECVEIDGQDYIVANETISSATPDDMNQYYSIEEQSRHGVIEIEIEHI